MRGVEEVDVSLEKEGEGGKEDKEIKKLGEDEARPSLAREAPHATYSKGDACRLHRSPASLTARHPAQAGSPPVS